jgi:N-acetyl-anhydromuramyl-L-alanine amidase AmpD
MSNYKPLDLNKIVPVDVNHDVYFATETEKSQIVLHHTVSNPISVEGDIQTWKDSANGVSTCIIIQGNGTPYQLYSSRYWSHHLGIKSSFLKEKGFVDYMRRNVNLNKSALGIEIDNWGGLTYKNDNFYAAYGNIVNIPSNQILELETEFRGYKYFQKYTQEQIDTTAELLLFWNERYNIPLKYNENMWDVSLDALSGIPGVWTHVSYRPDKSDCFPQPELIDMLKSISK